MSLAQTRQAASIQFSDRSVEAGIDFEHVDGGGAEGYLVSLMSSGLATLDYDNDGSLDAFLLNGHELPESQGSETNQLYRNVGFGKSIRFENVSAASLIGCKYFGLGVAAADYDNDGFVDIAVSNFGSVTLLHNLGDGTFVDATWSAGLSDSGIAFGAGVAFLDVENDGDLDLYVADYVDFNFQGFPDLVARTYPYPPGPDHFASRSDHLYRNNGDGTFSDTSIAAGIAAFASPSMGVVCGDFDGDHDTDIFVCSDARPNLLFINNGSGEFTQDAEIMGVAFNGQGTPVGSMGVDAADIDNDGLEDLFITDYSSQLPILFRNIGEFGFTDFSAGSRAGRDVVPHANWGAGLVDFDNDGDRDLLIGNGHLFQWAHRVEQLTDFKVRNCLLSNDGTGRFATVTEQAGSGLEIVESTRGIAFEDLDGDGDIDAIAVNSDARPSVLENTTQSSGNWIEIELKGTRFNRDGIGAMVTVEAGSRKQVAEVRSGRGYQSSYGTRLHFGLGEAATVDRIKVNWLGRETEVSSLPVNRIHVLTETE